jgi:hypothetical protein
MPGGGAGLVARGAASRQLYLTTCFGDPALQLRRPIPAPAFEAARSQSGVLIARVEIPTPARVTLLLETRRQALPHALEPVPPGEAGFEAIRRNHARANDKTSGRRATSSRARPR